MANAMLDARQEDGAYRRVELITGQRRRRRWTAEEKARIVAESFEEGANISEVARRHGVVRGLLTVWRRQVSRAVGVQMPGFVPVRIDAAGLPTAAHANPAEMTWSSGQCRGRIEIEVCEVRIRVEPGVDPSSGLAQDPIGQVKSLRRSPYAYFGTAFSRPMYAFTF
jgi:transposase